MKRITRKDFGKKFKLAGMKKGNWFIPLAIYKPLQKIIGIDSSLGAAEHYVSDTADWIKLKGEK